MYFFGIVYMTRACSGRFLHDPGTEGAKQRHRRKKKQCVIVCRRDVFTSEKSIIPSRFIDHGGKAAGTQGRQASTEEEERARTKQLYIYYMYLKHNKNGTRPGTAAAHDPIALDALIFHFGGFSCISLYKSISRRHKRHRRHSTEEEARQQL